MKDEKAIEGKDSNASEDDDDEKDAVDGQDARKEERRRNRNGGCGVSLSTVKGLGNPGAANFGCDARLRTSSQGHSGSGNFANPDNPISKDTEALASVKRAVERDGRSC